MSIYGPNNFEEIEQPYKSYFFKLGFGKSLDYVKKVVTYGLVFIIKDTGLDLWIRDT